MVFELNEINCLLFYNFANSYTYKKKVKKNNKFIKITYCTERLVEPKIDLDHLEQTNKKQNLLKYYYGNSQHLMFTIYFSSFILFYYLCRF